MEFFEALSAHYKDLAITQGLSGLMGKISLIAVIGIYLDGVLRDRGRYLAGIFAVHFFTAFYMNIAAGGGALLIGLASLALLGASIKTILDRQADVWEIAPEDAFWGPLVWIAYGFALIYPFWANQTVIGRIFYSLTAVTPHQTLMVLLLLLALRGQEAPRLLTHTAIASAILIAVIDSLAGNLQTGFGPLLYGMIALLLCYPIKEFFIEVGEDNSSLELPEEQGEKPKKSRRRNWDLK